MKDINQFKADYKLGNSKIAEILGINRVSVWKKIKGVGSNRITESDREKLNNWIKENNRKHGK